jgi:uncharacterized protein YciI
MKTPVFSLVPFRYVLYRTKPAARRKIEWVPRSTDARIDQITARIRVLCSGPFSPETEAELRKMAGELRSAIKQHVQMAKSSLAAKQAAIKNHDPGFDPE